MKNPSTVPWYQGKRIELLEGDKAALKRGLSPRKCQTTQDRWGEAVPQTPERESC